MSDPLEQLRLDPESVSPDPAFAARLRARLARLLEGDAVTARAITPYLSMTDARRALEWYADVWGAEQTMDPIVMPDGRIGHAELRIGETVIMMADEFPDLGFAAPGAESSPVSLHLTVDDADAAVARAAAAGAEVTRPVESYPHGRQGGLRDPFGHRWIVSQPPEQPVLHRTRPGDIAYFTMGVADVDRAQAFYGALLGWTFSPGATPGGFDINGVNPHGGMWGGGSGVSLSFRVADVAAAVEQVRRLGGTAEEPQPRAHGLLAECTDDQGTAFYVWQPAT